MSKYKVSSMRDIRNKASDLKIPLQKIRFFVGKNMSEPKVFGIYQDGKDFIVYKNKASGERSIRYQGPSEAAAAQIFWDRLEQEIKRQKKNRDWWIHQELLIENDKENTRRIKEEASNEFVSKLLKSITSIVISAAIIVTCGYAIHLIAKSVKQSNEVKPETSEVTENYRPGYYHCDSNWYYYVNKYWYLFDDGFWNWYGVTAPILNPDYTYSSDVYDIPEYTEDVQPFYGDHDSSDQSDYSYDYSLEDDYWDKEWSQSWDSDWDSSDSYDFDFSDWDYSGTDWESDW